MAEEMLVEWVIFFAEFLFKFAVFCAAVKYVFVG